MRIAVNMRFVLKGRLEGIGWFSWETVRRMVVAHPEHTFVFFFDRAYAPEFADFPNVEAVVLSPPARHPLLWWIWFELALPRALKRSGADLFLSPDGYCSLRTSVPTLLVIHDLAFEHYADHVPGLVLRYFRRYTPLYARHAARIATVSAFSKQDIVARYRVDAGAVDVVYNGANDAFRPLTAAEVVGARDRFAGGARYFVYVGAIHPRKNLRNLLLAFDQYKASRAQARSVSNSSLSINSDSRSDLGSGSGSEKLVIAGRMAWQTGPTKAAYEGMAFKKDVILMGHLQVADLALLIGGASGMLYPSLFEGFGIPVLEAIQAGIPVLTSKVSSLPEVGGDAALLVDPTSVDEIAEGIASLAELDSGLAARLEAGRAVQLSRFSWEKSAARLWESLMKVAESAKL